MKAMEVYCGIDWAEQHQDVAVVDLAGEVLVQRRIGDDLAGFTALTAVLDQLATGRDEVGIALETDRGLFVRALRSGGFRGVRDQPQGGGSVPSNVLCWRRRSGVIL